MTRDRRIMPRSPHITTDSGVIWHIISLIQRSAKETEGVQEQLREYCEGVTSLDRKKGSGNSSAASPSTADYEAIITYLRSQIESVKKKSKVCENNCESMANESPPWGDKWL